MIFHENMFFLVLNGTITDSVIVFWKFIVRITKGKIIKNKKKKERKKGDWNKIERQNGIIRARESNW